MFVQSEKFVELMWVTLGDISIWSGVQPYPGGWPKWTLPLRGIDGNLGKEHADSFHVICTWFKGRLSPAKSPRLTTVIGGDATLKDDKGGSRALLATNANFAWVQHFVYTWALPSGWICTANGSMSSNQSGEGELRKNIIEADLVDCMVSLPGQLLLHPDSRMPVVLLPGTAKKAVSGS